MDDIQTAATRAPMALVIAGPGTGKTTVLVGWMLQRSRHGPVIGLTFSREAALEINRRHGQRDPAVSAATIHAVAYRILRLSRGTVRIGSEMEAGDLFRQAVMEVLGRDPTPDEIRHYRGAIDRLVEDGFPLQHWPAALREIGARYLALKRECGIVDFPDLLIMAREDLEKHPELRAIVRAMYPQMAVDEAQDLSRIMVEILNLVYGGEGLLVVGSPAQAIYDWRGANHRLFPQWFRSACGNSGTEIILKRNYRSASPIVEAGKSIGRGYPDAEQQEPVLGDGPPISVVTVADPQRQAEWVAHKVGQLVADQMGSIGVLGRTNSDLLPVEAALSRNNIPYTLQGSTLPLWLHWSTGHILAYLRLATPEGRDHADSLARIINIPPRGLSTTVLQRLPGPLRSLSDVERAIQQDALPTPVREALRDLLLCIQQAATMSPANAVEHIVRNTGYLDWIEQEPDGHYVRNLLRVLHREASRFQTIQEFLEHAGKHGWPAQDAPIRLGTIHSAKGLQYDYVIVLGVTEGNIPHRLSLEAGQEGLEAERRLFYVALTRARKKAWLMVPRSSGERFRDVLLPSRFLNLLPPGTWKWEQ